MKIKINLKINIKNKKMNINNDNNIMKIKTIKIIGNHS